jgi:hypothetical protein
MLAILQFVLSDFWTFVGAAILLSIVSGAVSTAMFNLGQWTVAFATAVIARRG